MIKEKYVLQAKIDINSYVSDGYYTGKSYTFQGERYAIVDQDINNAKIYNSEARVIKASEMLFVNYTFEVVRR